MAVAYSAGRDSTALLHATARAAREHGLDVVALHVHHGLMPQADAWLAFAASQCGRWRKSGLPVRLLPTRLHGQPSKGESVEAWARRERYAALAGMAREAGATAVLLAHHRRDQAETVLLQALRGAGPAGLAAMPRAVQRDGLWWLRPWLGQPGEAIDAYVRRHRLRHVDDGSNADPRFARSRLRTTLWPALLAAFDDAEAALAAVAQRAHEANALLDEVAQADLATLVGEGDGAPLLAQRWQQQLSAARRANALRVWLRRTLGRGAPQALVSRLLDELPQVRSGRWPVGAGQQLALHRGQLSLMAMPAAATPMPALRERGELHPGEPGHDISRALDAARVGPGMSIGLAVDLSHPGTHPLPQWHGAFEVRRVARGGIAAAALQACTVRARGGGERFQAHAKGVPRSLKKQYQATGVAAWQRGGPLVYRGDQLLFVPGLGFDARALGTHGAARGVVLRWRPDDNAG
ncbi:MAG: tRNA lysidine(34) synthetase TilS [Ideonella sp.]|nr:tRNA lysidine(34) synthetase TilS [Ideonella sp.]